MTLAFLPPGDGDHVGVRAGAGEVYPGVGLVPDPPDVGAALADDVLVELLEDGHLDLEAALSHIIDQLGEVLAAVVQVLSWTPDLDNVTLDSEIGEADLNIGKSL